MKYFDLIHTPEISTSEVAIALAIATKQTASCLPAFSSAFKHIFSTQNFYPTAPNDQWTNGFWTGELWLAYENCNDEAFRHAAMLQVDSFLERIEQQIETDTHDLGFLYSPSCVAAYKLTADPTAKKAALLAADQLVSRFHKKGQFLQAWGSMQDQNKYRLIIDCLLNLPLLYWASEVSSDSHYASIANAHFHSALQVVIRPDYSTYHTYYFDPTTGLPHHGETHQGYSADSAWSRGQSWGIYGIALSYRYTKKEEYAKLFDHVLEFFIRHLPENHIPYWDFTFNDSSDEPRDSSALAVAICGLFEMADCLSSEQGEAYRSLGKKLLKSLVDLCSAKSPEESNGQLLHGVYGRKTPYNDCIDHGIDECNLWGDYFYVEALTRLSKPWVSYW